jgi:hypothetical protein
VRASSSYCHALSSSPGASIQPPSSTCTSRAGRCALAHSQRDVQTARTEVVLPVRVYPRSCSTALRRSTDHAPRIGLVGRVRSDTDVDMCRVGAGADGAALADTPDSSSTAALRAVITAVIHRLIHLGSPLMCHLLLPRFQLSRFRHTREVESRRGLASQWLRVGIESRRLSIRQINTPSGPSGMTRAPQTTDRPFQAAMLPAEKSIKSHRISSQSTSMRRIFRFCAACTCPEGRPS